MLPTALESEALVFLLGVHVLRITKPYGDGLECMQAISVVSLHDGAAQLPPVNAAMCCWTLPLVGHMGILSLLSLHCYAAG
jgi:hypothetical protein